MSLRISFIAGTGLIEMPPVSKVMPLPTSTTWVRASAGLPVQLDQARAAGRAAADGEDAAEALGRQLARGSRTRRCRSGRPAAAAATCSANHCGLFTEEGVLVRSRASRVISAVVRAVSSASPRTRPGRRPADVDRRSAPGVGRRPSVSRNRYDASSSPSARPRTRRPGDVGRQRDGDHASHLRRPGPAPRRRSASPPRRRRRRRAAAAAPGVRAGAQVRRAVSPARPVSRGGRQQRRRLGRHVAGGPAARSGPAPAGPSGPRSARRRRTGRTRASSRVGADDQTDGQHAGPYLQEVRERTGPRRPRVRRP